MTLLHRQHRFLPLERYLGSDEPIRDRWKAVSPTSSILLTSIKNVDRDLVSRLEQAGIYDSDDLSGLTDEVVNHLGLSSIQLHLLRDEVNQALSSQVEVPHIIVDLPTNYGVVAVASSNELNSLAVLWCGFLVSWSTPRTEGWHMAKFAFDELMEKMHQPKLIGSRADLPSLTWLDNITDISTYISSILPQTSIGEVVQRWGFPPEDSSSTAQSCAEHRAMQLTYSLQLAGDLSEDVS